MFVLGHTRDVDSWRLLHCLVPVFSCYNPPCRLQNAWSNFMEGSSTPEANEAAISAAVASILGVKGLRFRPHGSSQKAHVVLRRVVEEDDSSDDGRVTRVVRFSLFAHKRIEVKPGKEILLTVATQDGSFKDTAVVFEGDLPGDESDSVEEDITPAVKEEEEEMYYPPLGHAIPPKMRRAWTKRIEEVISVARKLYFSTSF